MDDIVKQALLKWPKVPACYGWLALDARGNWYLRDESAQAIGPFASLDRRSKGDLLNHEKLREFIGRNYEVEAGGCWFFQNGPQKVYVELEATPWIWRVNPEFTLLAHTGVSASAQRCVLDEFGRVYMETNLGFGLVHSLDVGLAAEAIEAGLWVPQQLLAHDLPQRFGYVRRPQAVPREP